MRLKRSGGKEDDGKFIKGFPVGRSVPRATSRAVRELRDRKNLDFPLISSNYVNGALALDTQANQYRAVFVGRVVRCVSWQPIKSSLRAAAIKFGLKLKCLGALVLLWRKRNDVRVVTACCSPRLEHFQRDYSSQNGRISLESLGIFGRISGLLCGSFKLF